MTRITAAVVTGDADRLPLLLRCVRSLESEADELVFIGPDEETTSAVADESPVPYVTAVEQYPLTLSEARNQAAGLARDGVVAFLDDDVTVSPGWGDALRSAFDDGALAAGGPAVPRWERGRRPAWLPKRWDWLVGCGPYHDEEREVRNTYGCNIAFHTKVFDDLDGFDEELGLGTGLQGEETDLCLRMHGEYGERVRFMPGAEVRHYVDGDKLSTRGLLARAWVQGRTKAVTGMRDEESAFIRRAIDPREPWALTACTVLYTAAVLGGYAAGRLVPR